MSLVRRAGHPHRDDTGLTLPEMLISIIVMGILGSIVTAAVSSSLDSYSKVDNDLRGLQDVRTVQERLSRDLRQARGVDPGATSSDLAIWIDDNSDYVKDANEVYVWRVVDAPGGGINKHVERVNQGTGVVQTIGRTLIARAVFTYSAADVTQADVVTSTIEYNALIGKLAKLRHVTFAIKLRNYG